MSTKILLFCLLNSLILINGDSESDTTKVVKIKSGKIRGSVEHTIFDWKKFYAFRGIPYAKPPIGKRRFALAEKPYAWDNILDTTKFGSECPQSSEFFNDGKMTGSEDCLFLNVYAPDTRSTDDKLDVMVFIHGGDFVAGSGNDKLYGPDFFIENNVILITMNYRLGALGFLNLVSAIDAGNMGLKDQVLALQWIQDNIHIFGGDKTKVTIFGEGAGGISVHLHTLSPVSKNLFNRAIVQSGTAISFLKGDSSNFSDMLKFAERNKANVTFDRLIDYLQDVDVELLTSSLDISKNIKFKFVPTIEHKSIPSAFITEQPEIILKNYAQNRCEIMFGYTKHESLLVVANEVNKQDQLNDLNEKFTVILPSREFRALRLVTDSEGYTEMLMAIRQYYFQERPINVETFNELVALQSDTRFIYDTYKSARLQSEMNTNIFYYRFSVEAELNLFKIFMSDSGVSGSAHADELCYLFKCKVFESLYKNLTKDSIEMKAIKSMTKLWTNFAKFGNPTENNEDNLILKPIKNLEMNFVDITNEGLKIYDNFKFDFADFWDKLLSNYRFLLDEEKYRLNHEFDDEL